MQDLLSLVAALWALLMMPAQVPTAPPGTHIEDVVVGAGPCAAHGSRVTIHFTAWTADRRELASTELRGLPFSFVLDSETPLYFSLIDGMSEGGERVIEVPPALAHGLEGVAGIVPPAVGMVVRVRLLRVDR